MYSEAARATAILHLKRWGWVGGKRSWPATADDCEGAGSRRAGQAKASDMLDTCVEPAGVAVVPLCRYR